MAHGPLLPRKSEVGRRRAAPVGLACIPVGITPNPAPFCAPRPPALGFLCSPWCHRAVASLNTPYRPADPSVDIVEKMKSIPTFDYQFYFQEPVRKEGKFINLIILGAQTPPPGRMGGVPVLGSPARVGIACPMAKLLPPGALAVCPPPKKKAPCPHAVPPKHRAGLGFPPQGVAEAELEKDVGRTLKALIRSTRKEVGKGLGGGFGGGYWDLGAAWHCPSDPQALSILSN